MASLTIVTNTARPAAESLRVIAQSSALKRAAGTGQRRLVRQHLRALPPNKQGFPTTGFYQSAAESVTAPEVTADTVAISITQIGFRQRFLGGDIVPINGTYLTRAAQSISYGKRAREFTGLKFAYAQDENGNLRPALVSTEAFEQRGTVRNRKGMGPKPPFGPGSVVYWLYRHVHQDPDPSVLPTPAELQAAAAAGGRSYVRAKLHDPTAEVVLTEDEAQ